MIRRKTPKSFPWTTCEMSGAHYTPFPPFGKRFFKRIRKIIGGTHFSHLGKNRLKFDTPQQEKITLLALTFL